jgi:hypothetical protein
MKVWLKINTRSTGETHNISLAVIFPVDKSIGIINQDIVFLASKHTELAQHRLSFA